MRTLPIQHCSFEFECPQDFSKLVETKDSSIRFCNQCQKNVYLCLTTADLVKHSQAGHCVSLAVRPCSATSLKRGDVVRITSGTFENFDASIENVDPEKDSAQVILHIFGRVTPMWMSTADLGIVADGN